MCGIAGALVFDAGTFTVTEPYLCAMRDVMAHRGPDGTGFWIAPRGQVGLAHRRLSIIDLSETAAQPMGNEDGTLQVVFNGEIYNHAEIRRDLEALGGHRWRTDHSDTEVILHAFETWGIDCLHRFRGMFAFALWDARENELWLVRDRVGIKPLYWSAHHGRLTFASEIKALLEDPDQPRAVDDEALYHYLSFLTTPAPQTLFAGIRKLPAGTWMRVRANGDIETRKYWDVWDHVSPLTGESESAIAERILETLRTAVQYRKVSDVPVGVFLSGGIDSSTNAALFSEGESSRVKTFSVAYRDQFASYPSELPYARQMAALVGAEHHEYLISTEDLRSFLPRMVHLQDEPIADPVCVPVYYVSKLAREHGVTVCQVGEGADELFIGYPNWKAILDRQAWADLPGAGLAAAAATPLLRAAGYGHTYQFEAIRRASQSQPLFWGGAEAFTEGEKAALLGGAVRERLRGVSSWDVIRPVRQRFEQAAWDQAHVNWMSYADLNLRLPELLLMRVDKMSMGVSLEGRVPFLDHEFVSLALSIPSSMKLGGGELKHMLKRAVRGLIPDALIDRRKQGFGVPVNEMLPGPLLAMARAEVARFTRDTGLLDPKAADRVMTTADGSKVWYLMNLAMWWRHFIAREPLALEEGAA
ncbi:MAG: asparagine synthase (glutamine-hydrolyzing) [Vicinamibacterales bacterium]|nr:asparagine synthase (glutamine-hydrolyzing) [Vicinamibacterales bacterium]